MRGSELRGRGGLGTNSVRALIVTAKRRGGGRARCSPTRRARTASCSTAATRTCAPETRPITLPGFLPAVGGAVEQARSQKGLRRRGGGRHRGGHHRLDPAAGGPRGHPAGDAAEVSSITWPAQAWLWKDHSSYAEAAAITEAARRRREPYWASAAGHTLRMVSGRKSSTAATPPRGLQGRLSWVECCDLSTGFITGNTDPLTMKRSVCAAGKGDAQRGRGGLPSKRVFVFAGAGPGPRWPDRLYSRAYTSDETAGGGLARGSQKRSGCRGRAGGGGAFTRTWGAVGAGIKPGHAGQRSSGPVNLRHDGSRAERHAGPGRYPGRMRHVPGSIIPGMLGIEAGQSAVGDIFKLVRFAPVPAGVRRRVTRTKT